VPKGTPGDVNGLSLFFLVTEVSDMLDRALEVARELLVDFRVRLTHFSVGETRSTDEVPSAWVQ
jgi:hypothetical protein